MFENLILPHQLLVVRLLVSPKLSKHLVNRQQILLVVSGLQQLHYVFLKFVAELSGKGEVLLFGFLDPLEGFGGLVGENGGGLLLYLCDFLFEIMNDFLTAF